MKSAREVSKFRRVVEVLAAPDRLVYGGMIFGGSSPLLSQELPMVDESPFAALPDSAEVSGENVASGGAARRATTLGAASPVVAVGKAPGLARRRDETAVAPSAATAGNGPAVPVFSLRRAGQREAGGRVGQVGRQAAEAAASAALPAAGGVRELQAGSEHVPAGAPAGAGRRIDNPPQLAKLPHKGKDEETRRQAGFGKLKHAPPMQAVSPAAALNAALVEVGRLADALVSGAGGSDGSFASPGELSATAGGNGVRSLEELRPQAGVGGLQPLDTAMEEVGRLAGALVGGGGESLASFAPLGAPTAAASQGGYPAGQTLGQTANLRQTAPEIHVTPGFAADAEWLAALVNEALTEQARRHGVDLS
jgi:hypothetical protein